ncbi:MULTISPECIES: TonB-dependent receptor domain-containing protein [Phenylobacterium]|uniref:Iron complex outermembrane receptor protein n=1 Tax=Phenylobacterium koreense TaxID=266125 RepID=A0ABV2EGJ9_9CAUL
MLKSRYFCSGSIFAVALALGVSGAAAAQESGGTVEEVVVTGSFIAGTPEDAALPVDVIGTKELEARGSPTMVQLIKTIPSSGAVIGENNRFGGGSGAASINLRNLNSPSTGSRTLVLFNGRRVPVSPQSLNSVDINLLPTAAIGRVEVLKDGAAATYGSDAIGGVVNFITRTDLDGFELSGQYQLIDGSDGDYDVSAAWGKKWDNADALITVGYRHRSKLPIFERDWAIRTGVDGFRENPLGGWASTGNPGQYNVITATTPHPNGGFQTATLGAGLPDIGCAANGGAPFNISTVIGARTITPDANSCQFQYTTFDNLVENEDHFQAYGKFNFDVTDTLSANIEVLYAMHDTPNQSWAVTGPNQFPTPLSVGGTSPMPATPSSDQGRFYIPNTNPGLAALIGQVNAANCNGAVLPYGIDAASCLTALNQARTSAAIAAQNGVVASQTSWRPIGFGGNPYTEDKHAHYSYKVDTFRVSGGFKGEAPLGIKWDTALTYQQQDYTRVQEDISVNRLQQGLSGFGSRAGAADQCTAAETANWTTNAGNAAMGCYYFNPFANAFAESLAQVGPNPFYIANSTIPGFNDAAAARGELVDWMDERLVNRMQNRLFVADVILNGELPLELAGGSIKWAGGAQYRYDQYKQNPEVLHDVNATPCVDSPPFGDGQPFCLVPTGPYLFNANNEQYNVSREIISVFGETLLPITDDLELTLAARYETYGDQGETFNPKASVRWQAVDWLALRGSVGTTYRAPSAIITTDNFSRGLTNANGTWRANDQYGNPDLDAETAFTYSIGAMADFGAFRATVDYWSFDFEDQLVLENASEMLAAAFPASGPNVCTSTDPAYVALRSRFTFTDAGCGRANVQSYRTKYINGGKVKTSGIDFQANLDVGDVFEGALTTGFDGSYLLEYDESPYMIEGVPTSKGVQKRAGTFRASIFTGYNRLRANAYVNWARGIHNLRWQMRYISSTTQTDSNSIGLAIATKQSTKIPEYWQHDLTYRVELPWDTTLTASVQNIFDEDPPFAIGTQYSYDPGSANPLGRVFAIAAKKRF